MSYPKLSISIINFQSESFIEECLASVFTHLADLDFEVIVVNNDEKENLENVRKNFPKVKIIDHKRNVGFGAGHNLGAKKAEGEILLFLNPDTELLESITPIMEFFEKNKNIGIAGPRLLSGDGKIQPWIAGKETNLWNVVKNNFGISSGKKIWKSTRRKKTHWITGAAFFIRKSLWDNLGGFDENFFMFFEDEDLCKRARKAGSAVVYFPEVKAKHFGGRSTKDKEKQKEWYYKSQEYYFQKHLGRWQTLALKILRKAVLGV